MMPQAAGALRLFHLFGIHVFLHWSWFLLLLLVATTYDWRYSSFAWGVVEIAAIFALVTMHEFGHALACRSVGGRADRIVLWPLGGVAFVQPPKRPAAVLWSIVAGPLVNVALVPITVALMWAVVPMEQLAEAENLVLALGGLDDVHTLVVVVTLVNVMMLVFNLLPAFPLDGGQILHALLWFQVGYARSLLIAAQVGLALAILGGLAALLLLGSLWLTILAVFIGFNSFHTIRVARLLILEEHIENDPWR